MTGPPQEEQPAMLKLGKMRRQHCPRVDGEYQTSWKKAKEKASFFLKIYRFGKD
jgi:hypothetical protein